MVRWSVYFYIGWLFLFWMFWILDIDECLVFEFNVCVVRILCENLNGGYKCVCEVGFELVDKNEIEGVDMKCKGKLMIYYLCYFYVRWIIMVVLY